VSVLVPAYGVAELLGEALASLQAQSFADWEAIVVDDGDRDRVQAAFSAFAADPRFRLLQTDNGGPSVARNRAAAAARAPLMSMLDGDDQYAPGYLARMVPAIEADPAIGFVACDAMMFGARPHAGRLYSSLYPIEGPATLERVIRRDTAIYTAVLMRRRAFLEAGGFDETIGWGEDLDLWIRILAAGWRAEVVPEPLARYRRRPGSLTTQPRKLLSGACAVYRKTAGALAGQPAAVAAEAALARCERELRWLDGEAALLDGDVAGGLELLAGAETRSARWRVALAVMRRAPGLAGMVMKMR
jgi:glycosyltransferase involved in cell wall biosynthesis